MSAPTLSERLVTFADKARRRGHGIRATLGRQLAERTDSTRRRGRGPSPIGFRRRIATHAEQARRRKR
jgi:hypothetical protein